MLVKKDWVKLAVLLIAGTALLSTVCFAAEPNKPSLEDMLKPSKVQGMVNVAKDANDVITKVTVVTKDKAVFNVTLDAKGMELGKAMANKEVEVEGIVSKKDMKDWIKVQSFKAVEKAAEAPKPAAPKAPEAK